MFFSQASTGPRIDELLHKQYFTNVCNGVFVDVGAGDGLTNSHTKFFEKYLSWRGLCVEPNPVAFRKLVQARPGCANVEGAISNERGAQEFLQVLGYAESMSGFVAGMSEKQKEQITSEIKLHGGSQQLVTTQAYLLGDLLRQHEISVVDLLSVDVAGSELSVLESIDFGRALFRAMVIEEGTVESQQAVSAFLRTKSYARVGRLGGKGLYVWSSRG